MKVFDGEGRLIMRASLADNKTFKIEINMVDHQCLASTAVEDKNWLWHHKYGHLNFRSLSVLNKKQMVYDLPQINESIRMYEESRRAKQTKRSLKHDLLMKSKKKLELMHFLIYVDLLELGRIEVTVTF